MRSRSLIKFMLFSLYALGSLESVGASSFSRGRKSNDARVSNPTQYNIRSPDDKHYALFVSDKAHYHQESLSFLAKQTSFINLALEIYEAAPINITKGCGGHKSNKDNQHFRKSDLVTIGFAGESSARGSNLHMAKLMYPQNMPRNITFENCLLDSFDYLSYKELEYDFEFNMIVFKILLMVMASLLILRTCCLNIPKRETPLESIPTINEDRAKKIGLSEDEIPEEFICTITSNLMDEPVRTFDATPASNNPRFDRFPSYESIAIRNWLKNHNYAPHSGLPLANKTLTPDTKLKVRIEDFIKAKEFLFQHKKQFSVELSNLSKRKIRAYSK